MAFQLVQKFNFEGIAYDYDRERDVLEVSFGPPAPAITIQVEDWLAIRMQSQPPFFQGMTIVGFKSVFEKLNRYVEEELPQRMKSLASATVEICYDDSTDTLIMRVGDVPSPLRQTPSIFEPLAPRGAGLDAGVPEESLRTVYVEKSLPDKEIVGIKMLQFTRLGPAALEATVGAIIDTLFEPKAEHGENVHSVTNALIERLDWQKLATLAA